MKVSFERIQGQRNGMVDVPPGVARCQVPRFPHGTYQHASPRPDPDFLAVPLQRFVYCDLRQLRTAPYVAEPDSGDAAKLLVDGSHSLFEPDWSDLVSVAVYRSDADRNDRVSLGFGQLLIVKRDDDDSHALFRCSDRLSLLASRSSVPFPRSNSILAIT